METFITRTTMERTRESLINLYVGIAKEKLTFRFDPKKMILDLLPMQADLYRVFLTKSQYPLSQSVLDYGKLEIAEHRFINFLKYASLTQQEIDHVFNTFEKARPTHLRKRGAIPLKWRYSVKELYQFVTASKNAAMTIASQEPVSHRVELTREEVEKLYTDDIAA